MRSRKLRIAWSVAWGAAAVLLIALWVRSYFCGDDLVVTITKLKQLELQSVNGVCIGFIAYAPSRPITSFVRYQQGAPESFANAILRHEVLGGDLALDIVWAAHWLVAAVFVFVGVLPWTSRFRFSLRTLLIATTLVAVVLGIAVWQKSR